MRIIQELLRKMPFGIPSPPLPSPKLNTPEQWRTYWESQGQPWRREPEIDLQRQTALAQKRVIVPDIEKGMYPFKDMKLSRADVEWLLATHEHDRGPVDWSDENQRRRQGLDLRGADLRHADLQSLPIAGVCGGLTVQERVHGTEERCQAAAILLEGANLSEAHLEGAYLYKAHLAGANFQRAFLTNANLSGALLEGAHGCEAQLKDADLSEAQLNGLDLSGAYLQGMMLNGRHLEGVTFNRAHLEGALLHGAYLNGVQLQGAFLTRANLADAHLDFANLSEAHLEDTFLQKASLTKANLNQATLARANLTEAYLVGASAVKTHLEEAVLTGAHCKDAIFTEAFLQRADLTHTEFESAHLGNAHLEGAYLFETSFCNAYLRGVFFDRETQLVNITLGDEQVGVASISDVRWGDTNLAVVNWPSIRKLGDEIRANGYKDKRDPEYLRHYRRGVRANRQLAVALQAQGQNEDAMLFAYRAQVLQKKVWLSRMAQPNIKLRQRVPLFGAWLFSWFLFLIAGYGYKVWRSFLAYLLIIGTFTALYLRLDPHLAWYEALVVSMTAFHGRGFSPSTFSPGDPLSIASACEAFVGLIIEVTFIATLTQRFFNR
jgi:uncharacterized protein YjbI with pentapeptide repeats